MSEDIESIPDEGKILDQFEKNDSVYSRSVFPITDVSGNKVAGVIVLQNITEIFLGMKGTRNTIVIFNVIQAILICCLLILILYYLVFRRLNFLIDKATRVVGGDYYTSMATKSNDEVGKFETLFDQFRTVFVSLLEQMGLSEERK